MVSHFSVHGCLQFCQPQSYKVLINIYIYNSFKYNFETFLHDWKVCPQLAGEQFRPSDLATPYQHRMEFLLRTHLSEVRAAIESRYGIGLAPFTICLFVRLFVCTPLSEGNLSEDGRNYHGR